MTSPLSRPLWARSMCSSTMPAVTPKSGPPTLTRWPALAAAWRAKLEANLISAVLTTAALTPRSGGTVINVGSIGAERGGGSYGAAKAAVAAWTAMLSAELGARGVTANSISPGYVEATEFFRGQLSDERRTVLIGQTHTGRASRPR